MTRPADRHASPAPEVVRGVLDRPGPQPRLPRLPGFTVTRVLGHGSMGGVFLAERSDSGALRAIKLVHDHLASKPVLLARFELEAQAAALVVHPGVVRVFGLHRFDGLLAIEMEYIEGSDLRDLLGHGPPARQTALSVISQVAAGLDAVHAHGLVHRDVKPSNVLLATDGRAALADFGVVWHMSSDLTSSQTFIGSHAYAPPEQIEGAQVDRRSDIYSLGCLAVELLTGDVPFREPSSLAMMRAHLTKPAPAIAAQLALPLAIDTVIARALAKDPTDRYQAAGMFAADLLAAAGESPTSVALPPAPAPGLSADLGAELPQNIAQAAQMVDEVGQSPKNAAQPVAESRSLSGTATLAPEPSLGHRPKVHDPLARTPPRRRRLLAGVTVALTLIPAGAFAFTQLIQPSQQTPETPDRSSSVPSLPTTSLRTQTTSTSLVVTPATVSTPESIVTLRAKIAAPKVVTQGACIFERKLTSGWTRIGRSRVSASACSLKTRAGTSYDTRNYLRARFVGTSSISGSRSRAAVAIVRAKPVAPRITQPAGSGTRSTTPAPSSGGWVTVS